MACFPCWGRSNDVLKGDTRTLPQIQVLANTGPDNTKALVKSDDDVAPAGASPDGCAEASLLQAKSLSHADSQIKPAPITEKAPHNVTAIELLRDIAELQFVGQGASGNVFRGIWQGAVVAVKYVVSQSSDSQDAAANEASLSRMLAHPNVVQTFSCKTVNLSSEFFSQLGEMIEVCQGQERTGMEFPYDDFQLSDVGPRSSQNPTEVVLPELARGLSGQRTASITAALQPRPETVVEQPLLPAVQHTGSSSKQHQQQNVMGDQGVLPMLTTDVVHTQQHSGTQPPENDTMTVPVSDCITQQRLQPVSAEVHQSVMDSVRRTASTCNPTTITLQGSPLPPIYVNLSGQVEQTTTETLPVGTSQHVPSNIASQTLRQPHRIVLSDDASIQPCTTTTSADKDQQLFNSHLDTAVVSSVAGISELANTAQDPVPLFPPTDESLQANTQQPALLEALKQMQLSSEQPQSQPQQSQQQQQPWPSLDSVEDVIPAGTLLALQDVLVRSNARLGYQLTQIVMEYCDKGSLQHAITRGLFLPSSKWGARLALRALLRTAQEIAQGMWHIHEASVIHGDLKPGNVLLKGSRWDRRGFVAKVSDFGLSRQSEHTAKDSQHWATVAYMAPETFEGLLARQSDVYSYGITLWQMVTGEKPWDGLHPGQVMVGVQTASLKLQWPDWVHPRLVRLGSSCLEYDRKKRPSFNAITKELAQIENQVRLESSNGTASPQLVASRMGSGSAAGNTAPFSNHQDSRAANQLLTMRPAALHSNPAGGSVTPPSQPSTAVVYVNDGSQLGNMVVTAPVKQTVKYPRAMVTTSVTGHLTPLMSRIPWPASGQDPHNQFSNNPIGPLQVPYSG